MDTVTAALILATFLCSLVAGFLFAFAVVAMPGIGRLPDRGFIRAFQVIDGVIQNNQPLFMLVWIGSVLALVAAVALAFDNAGIIDRSLLAGALVAYVLGVQLPTMVVNVPLNNQLQTVNVDLLDDAALASARAGFEQRWNASNIFRTVVSCLVSLTLMVAMTRM